MVVNIDHHQDNTRFGDLNLVEPLASSTAEVIAGVIAAAGWPLTAGVAGPLYVGLITDTGRFGYTNTRPGAHRVAAAMIEAGVDIAEMSRRLYEEQPLDRLLLTGRALERARPLAGGRDAGGGRHARGLRGGGRRRHRGDRRGHARRAGHAARPPSCARPAPTGRGACRCGRPTRRGRLGDRPPGGRRRPPRGGGLQHAARPRGAAGVDRRAITTARLDTRRGRWLRPPLRSAPRCGSWTSPRGRRRTTWSPASAGASGGGRRWATPAPSTRSPPACWWCSSAARPASRRSCPRLDKTYLATLRTGFTSVTGDPEGPVEPAGRAGSARRVARRAAGVRWAASVQRVPAPRGGQGRRGAAVPPGPPGRGRRAARARDRGARPAAGRGPRATAVGCWRCAAARAPTCAGWRATSASASAAAPTSPRCAGRRSGHLSVDDAVRPDEVGRGGGLDPGRGARACPARVLTEREIADGAQGRPVPCGATRRSEEAGGPAGARRAGSWRSRARASAGPAARGGAGGPPVRRYRSLGDLPLGGPRRVVAIGTFDGVHLGHQAVIGGAIEIAAERRLDAMALTFEPQPIAVLRPELRPGGADADRAEEPAHRAARGRRAAGGAVHEGVLAHPGRALRRDAGVAAGRAPRRW